LSPAVASLLALLAAIVLSCTSRLNVGLLATALAWGIGVFVAGWSADLVAGGFPTQLFLTLAGVTLLFAISEVNGTIEALAQRVLRLARGSAGLLPVLLFAMAMLLSTLGPGAVPTVALLAPMAMALGVRAGIPVFLTALMVANGANAGNLSPLSAVGVIANERMAAVGLGGHEWKVWGANLAAHLLVAAAAWMALAPSRRAGRRRRVGVLAAGAHTTGTARGRDGNRAAVEAARPAPLTTAQWLTIAAVSGWVAAVVVFRTHVGFGAFAAGVALIVFRAADESAAVKSMPWNAILMVCGVSLLIAVLEKTGGMDLFTALIARYVSPRSINGAIAFLTGAISTYSSTSGVVLPTFLPTVPSLVEQVGGGDPLAVALSINVGASLVDVSPLSTIGALCVAAVGDPDTSHRLFRMLLLWGLAMMVVGAVLCQLLAGPFARL
jgi:di/tricarboxylate transporter